jgi:hypothetical protein
MMPHRDQYTAAIETVERMQKIIEGPELDWTAVGDLATDLVVIADDPAYSDDGEES